MVINGPAHVPKDSLPLPPPAGHYMEAALIPSKKEDLVGRLKSPKSSQPANVQQCATFWYVHNGATFLDKLLVYAPLNGDYGKLLWKERGEMGGIFVSGLPF